MDPSQTHQSYPPQHSSVPAISLQYLEHGKDIAVLQNDMAASKAARKEILDILKEIRDQVYKTNGRVTILELEGKETHMGVEEVKKNLKETIAPEVETLGSEVGEMKNKGKMLMAMIAVISTIAVGISHLVVFLWDKISWKGN